MALNPLDPTTAVVLGPFIAAAYDQFRAHPNDLNPATISLPPGYTLLRTVQMSDFLVGPPAPRFYGFLAVGGTPPMQVLALRGTVTATEWFDDLHWDPVPFAPVANAGKVAEGFFDIYDTMTTMTPGQSGTSSGIAGIAAAVDPALPLVVTGHSLGGALTSMLVLDLTANTPLKPQAWTFASPKVGDAAFAARYASVSTVSWRIYNVPDPAPLIPIDPDGNYQHVNAAYAVNSLTYARWSVACAHELNTYLHGLNPVIPLDPGCRP
ncbi:lipase family protein [Rhodococcus sp. NPDC127528]|uniref:lipase family protein n=1 Tax=unclassified Rhodococcus (in: high G+C Gram-positive bacteria) TaxID=192944 RepID=UPI00363D45EC